MACLATKGRLLPCKDKIGGLYKLWFINFGTTTPVLNADNIITSLSGGSMYEYEIKGASKFIQDMVTNSNGTSVTQTLTVDLPGGDYITNNELLKFAYGRVQVVVQDNFGSAWLAGRLRGLDMTTSVFDFGAATTDKYGYIATFLGSENQYGEFLSGSTITNAFAGLSLSPTKVLGVLVT